MKSLTKKIVFIISLVGSLVILIITFLWSLLFLGKGICAGFGDTGWCGFIAPLNYRNLDNVFVGIFPVVLLFSIVTLGMKDSVFRAWFKLAKVYIPVMIVAMLYIGAQSNGGSFNMDAAFNLLFLVVFYLVFFVLSTVKIVRAYKASKV
jgi:hypothetical protein